MVGRACGVEGIRPGTYCEPKMTTWFTRHYRPHDTRRTERPRVPRFLCRSTQSFCHTAAYPKPVDIDTQHTLPDFIMNRAGVSLRPGDGIIHPGSTVCCSLIRLAPVVTHTRFPIGISFPAGSGLCRLRSRNRRYAIGYARVCFGTL